MKNYNNYILETNLWSGSKELSENKFWEIFNKNCKNFDPNIQITKEFKSLSHIDFIHIKNMKDRKSADGKNYYTLLINNLKSWKDFPKRQQICELDGFWGFKETSHIVIPFDNSKWGITTKGDIWWSRFLSGTVSDINMILPRKYISDENWKDFLHDIKNLSPVQEQMIFTNIFRELYKKKSTTINDLRKKYKTVYNFLETEFTPNKLGFKLLNYNELKNEKFNEIWTDSPCLYVKYNIYKKDILPKINSKLQ